MTKAAINKAITVANNLGLDRCLMLFASTNDGKKWYGQKMGRVMQAYALEQCPDLQTYYEEAPSFNTFGECVAITRFIIENRQRLSLTNLFLVVKDWHAFRTEVAQRLVFWKHRYPFPLACATHEASAPFRDRVLEIPKMGLVFLRTILYKPFIR